MDNGAREVRKTQTTNVQTFKSGEKGGGGMLEKKGATLAGDLMGTKARLLLMLAMAEVGNNLEKLKKYFK